MAGSQTDEFQNFPKLSVHQNTRFNFSLCLMKIQHHYNSTKGDFSDKTFYIKIGWGTLTLFYVLLLLQDSFSKCESFIILLIFTRFTKGM